MRFFIFDMAIPTMALIAMVGLVGCQQGNESASSSAISNANLTEASVVAASTSDQDEAKKECCGKCKQEEKAAASEKKECCGKCEQEVKAAEEKKDGCCGKCQDGKKTLTADKCCGMCKGEKGEAKKECCGKCKQEETATAEKKECCGKCEQEAKAAGEKKDGCCGKCQDGKETLTADKCCGMCKGEKGEAKKECCGKCKQEEKAAASEKKECCGKCEQEAKATGEKKGGCCGKCQDEITKEENTAQERCSKDCDACVKGDSAGCKCLDEESEASTTTSDNAKRPNTMREDRDIFHFLLQNHEKITRKVTELDNGVRTITESDDPAIAAKLQEHVASMHGRITDGRPLRMWDELYREVFKHHDKIEMVIEKTEKGVSVTETSDDPHVVKLIKQHAKVVSGFAKRGFEEARENHLVESEGQDGTR